MSGGLGLLLLTSEFLYPTITRLSIRDTFDMYKEHRARGLKVNLLSHSKWLLPNLLWDSLKLNLTVLGVIVIHPQSYRDQIAAAVIAKLVCNAVWHAGMNAAETNSSFDLT